MRFLDLDLDFFLSDSPYRRGHGGERQCSEYMPWTIARVRRFLEDKCDLSTAVPVCGRTMETHDRVIDFWRSLIESGKLKVPFEVIHLDAHPDLMAGDGVYLFSGLLHVDPALASKMSSEREIHEGNYLTFALACGWIESLVWVYLQPRRGASPAWDGDARSGLLHSMNDKDRYVDRIVTEEKETGVPFRAMPCRSFKHCGQFDYISFSKSPEFTPSESDRLIPVIEEYIRQI